MLPRWRRLRPLWWGINTGFRGLLLITNGSILYAFITKTTHQWWANPNQDWVLNRNLDTFDPRYNDSFSNNVIPFIIWNFEILFQQLSNSGKLFTLYLLIQNTSHKYVYHLYADCDLQFSTDVCVIPTMHGILLCRLFDDKLITFPWTSDIWFEICL